MYVPQMSSSVHRKDRISLEPVWTAPKVVSRGPDPPVDRKVLESTGARGPGPAARENVVEQSCAERNAQRASPDGGGAGSLGQISVGRSDGIGLWKSYAFRECRDDIMDWKRIAVSVRKGAGVQ